MNENEPSDRQGITEAVISVDLGNRVSCESSRNSVYHIVSESVIVIRSDEEGAACVSGENGNRNAKGNSNATANVLGSSNVPADGRKIKDLKDDNNSCVIDVNCGGNGKFGENLDGERVCRICHLNSDPLSETPARTTTTTAINITAATDGLIQLGCRCKDELGIVHAHCADAWFKLKGNRKCEICGETAKNVTGVGDNRFMEEWNETRAAGSGTNLSERSVTCSRGQRFCNFLMACLVIAFVLPWFFRVNMF